MSYKGGEEYMGLFIKNEQEENEYWEALNNVKRVRLLVMKEKPSLKRNKLAEELDDICEGYLSLHGKDVTFENIEEVHETIKNLNKRSVQVISDIKSWVILRKFN